MLSAIPRNPFLLPMHHLVKGEVVTNFEGGTVLRYKLQHVPLPETVTVRGRRGEGEILGFEVKGQCVIVISSIRQRPKATAIHVDYEYTTHHIVGGI